MGFGKTPGHGSRVLAVLDGFTKAVMARGRAKEGGTLARMWLWQVT